MNRPIKFRAWDDREKKMFPVDVLALSECSWACPDHQKRGVSLAYQPHIPVMQFTGSHDFSRPRKEIYEGDIIEIELDKDRAFTDGKPAIFRLVVTWEGSGFHMRRTDNNVLYSVGFGGSAVLRKEVIGNIHENPELLKGGGD